MLPLISLRNGATCWPKEMKIICIFLNNFGKQKQEESAAPIHYFVCFFLFFSPFLSFFTVLFPHSFTLSCYSFILLRYQPKSLSLSYPFSLYFLLTSFSPSSPSLHISYILSPSLSLLTHPSLCTLPSPFLSRLSFFHPPTLPTNRIFLLRHSQFSLLSPACASLSVRAYPPTFPLDK